MEAQRAAERLEERGVEKVVVERPKGGGCC